MGVQGDYPSVDVPHGCPNDYTPQPFRGGRHNYDRAHLLNNPAGLL